MKKVTVIGHFAFGLEYLDGQTVKTKMVADELCRQFGEDKIEKTDTHGGVKSLLKAPFHIFMALRSSNNVLILPAHNGLRVYAPLLAFGNQFFKNKKIHYVVIGGWLPAFLKKHSFVKQALKYFDCIYVETTTMKNALKKQGFTNVCVMPNFKRLTILNESILTSPDREPYPLCTFSRVMKEKGIEDAVNAVVAINEKAGHIVYTLDIYGQIDSMQIEWFDELKKSFPVCVRYCGSVESTKSVDILQKYFALLFPTRFYTEGIPGTIIDAYASGIPVISARWESFADVVDDGITGLGYDFDNSNALFDVLMRVANAPKVLVDMKSNCIEKSKEYLPETAMQGLMNNLTISGDC